MKNHFSSTQNKVIQKIWIFGIVLFALNMLLYCIDVFTPNTYFFKQLWYTINWLTNSLIIAWYLYKNNKLKQGIYFQLLSFPYFFWEGISFAIDYHLTSNFYHYIWYESNYIYVFMKYASSIIPLLYFVKEYFKIENTHLLKKTKWIYSFLISVVFFYAINADNTDVCRNFTFLTSENPYLQDCLIAITVLIGTFQILFILTGFFYITHKLNNISSLRKPIEEQFIGKNFFKWGFIISFSIFIFTLLNLGSSIFKISIYHSTEFDLIEILGLLANYFLLLYSGRFLGNLIQFRGYSLKKYFGIINVFTLAPILNIIPFLVLLLSKKRNDVREYLQKLNKNKNIHLLIYCVLIAAFLIYDYWSEEGKDPKVLIKIPVFIIAILLVTRFKIMTKIVPFVVVLYLYFEDVKAFFEITEDYLTFFKERIFSFLWLSSFAVFVVYYVIYYVLHKCFYVDYSQEKNLEKRIEDSTKFNEPKIN